MHLGTLVEPTWDYLGVLEAILGHLGRILGPRASKKPPGWLCPCPLTANLAHFGSHFGVQNLHFSGILWDYFFEHFLAICHTTFGHILGSILGTDRPKKGPRCAQEGHQELPRTKKLNFQKTLKNICFFKVFEIQKLPKRASRGPRRLPRGTQRAPKPQKKGSNNLSQN